MLSAQVQLKMTLIWGRKITKYYIQVTQWLICSTKGGGQKKWQILVKKTPRKHYKNARRL